MRQTRVHAGRAIPPPFHFHLPFVVVTVAHHLSVLISKCAHISAEYHVDPGLGAWMTGFIPENIMFAKRSVSIAHNPAASLRRNVFKTTPAVARMFSQTTPAKVSFEVNDDQKMYQGA